MEPSTLDLRRNRVEQTDQGQGSDGGEFRGADLRGERRDRRNLSASTSQLLQEARKVFGEFLGCASRGQRDHINAHRREP